MNVKSILKTVLVYVLVFIVGFVLHTNIFGQLKLGMVAPNIMLILTSFFGLMRGSNYGMIMGFISGLLLDAYSSGIFGINCLLFLLVGYINGLFVRFFYGDDIKMPMVLVFGSDLAYGLLYYLFIFFIRQRYNFMFYFLNIILPEATYTLIISLIMYYPLMKLLKWMVAKEKRESRGRNFG